MLWQNRDLVALGKMRGCLLDCGDELSLSPAFLAKAMLVVFQGTLLFKVCHDVAMDDVFQQFACYSHGNLLLCASLPS